MRARSASSGLGRTGSERARQTGVTIAAITGAEVAGRRLVVRADLNVPMAGGRVSDATRLTRFAQGMRPLLARGAALVVLSHLGRPTGRDESASLAAIAGDLAAALGRAVGFATLDEAGKAAARLRPGEVLLVENIRFEEGEARNDPALAARLAALGDFYVNDAFSCAHRAHASTAAIAGLLPAFAGPLMMEELAALAAALEAPAHPSVAIVGGAKVSSKIGVLKHLVTRLDHVIVGGGMANTFLFAGGMPMGRSLHEPGQTGTVQEILAIAEAHGCRVHLPLDLVVAREFRPHAPAEIVPADACPADAMILDAGPKAFATFARILDTARTILWNGPLGAFEIEPFDRATLALARLAAGLTDAGQTVTVAGGGDTVAALNAAGVAESFTYVSTAGGAFLEWLEGRPLPGVQALLRADAAS
ncbi:phosphoglycerate kinase [Pannonibacter phragmitetus]|uniref:phosphoglycerate kinase n=1 Tax=Pannonibacter phragmitetus TaxID=121719 RepID=UPI000F45332B|nr:phosphoglycerate kinase [Pannonibacter phragmitetus]